MNGIQMIDCLNPMLDWPALHEEFVQRGRIEIRDIFKPEIATRLQQSLRNEVPWSVAHNVDGEHKTIAPAKWAATPSNEQQLLWQKNAVQAKQQFRFWYESYMMVSAYLKGENPHLPLNALLEYFNSPSFTEKARQLTGFVDIRKVDAQATRYLPGHFLNAHDDHGGSQGQIRKAAYVLSLSEQWHADWGGLLHFYENGKVVESFVPCFNSLFVFATPQMHAVSFVAPYAVCPRLSITGWFRAD